MEEKCYCMSQDQMAMGWDFSSPWCPVSCTLAWKTRQTGAQIGEIVLNFIYFYFPLSKNRLFGNT